MATKFYDWEKRKRQAPGESLPRLPGIQNEKDFAKRFKVEKGSKRKYLDARAQYAGYASFTAWEKAREETGTKKSTPKRKEKTAKPLKTGNAFIFQFEQEGKTGKTIPIQRQYQLFRQMDRIIRGLGEEEYVQFYYLAHTYAKAGENRPINEWDWGATLPFFIGTFKKEDFRLSGHSMLNFFHQMIGVTRYTFPDERENFPDGYSWTMHGKTIEGFREIHVTVWQRPTDNHRK